MSTRCTIEHNDKWHLYEDAIDETVWIETRGFDFVAGPDSIRVHLPEAVIDAIRKADASRFPHLRTPNATDHLSAGQENETTKQEKDDG